MARPLFRPLALALVASATAILRGEQTLDASPDDRHALDTLLSRWHLGEPWQSHLCREFAQLLMDPDPQLAGAAIHFFGERSSADDGGGLLAALRFHAAALEGVRSTWYPDERDLRTLLVLAIAQRMARGAPFRDAVRAEALLPGRGAAVATLLVARDPQWFRQHAAEILSASPEAAAAPLGFIAMAHKASPADGDRHLTALVSALADGV